MANFRLFTVASPLVINCLGGIQGPLTTPTKMEFLDVLAMIKKGYEIYEHNPADPTEKIRVTLMNINNIQFKSNRAIASARRMENLELQELEKAMKVSVVTKEEAKKEVKHNETPKAQKESSKDEKPVKEDKIIKADAFTS